MEQLIALILQTIQDNITLSDTLELRQLPEAGGLAVQIAPSAPEHISLNKKEAYELNLLFLSKNFNQLTAFSELSLIDKYVSRLKTYPNTIDIEWVNATTTTKPAYVDTEDNGQFIYSMVLSCLISDL